MRDQPRTYRLKAQAQSSVTGQQIIPSSRLLALSRLPCRHTSPGYSYRPGGAGQCPVLGSTSSLLELYTELEKACWETQTIRINTTPTVHPDQRFSKSRCVIITPQRLFQEVDPNICSQKRFSGDPEVYPASIDTNLDSLKKQLYFCLSFSPWQDKMKNKTSNSKPTVLLDEGHSLSVTAEFASSGKINPCQNLGELNYCTVSVLLKPGWPGTLSLFFMLQFLGSLAQWKKVKNKNKTKAKRIKEG